jgi:hypothetical protein
MRRTKMSFVVLVMLFLLQEMKTSWMKHSAVRLKLSLRTMMSEQAVVELVQ